MDQQRVFAAFDQQMRRRPEPDGPDEIVECDDRVVRRLYDGGARAGVSWSDLDEATADAVIAAQISRFGARSWEWKHYSYDQPVDLPNRLLAAGFTPEPEEALLIAEITDLDLDVVAPPGVQLCEVVDPEGVEAFVSVSEEAFGDYRADIGRTLLAALGREPRTVEAVLALAGSTPVAAGRLELHHGTEFASLWGGGTAPAWRGRGVFRSLVAHRARIALARGFRYLRVDAMPDSRPILKRLGFVEFATTTPFNYPGKA